MGFHDERTEAIRRNTKWRTTFPLSDVLHLLDHIDTQSNLVKVARRLYRIRATVGGTNHQKQIQKENRELVKGIIVERGPISKYDIDRLVDISSSAVHNAIQHLRRIRHIEKADIETGRSITGKPPVRWRAVKEKINEPV